MPLRILNVAEKNDAAKNIAGIMSRGTSRRREGLSQYNKIYEFQHQFRGQPCEMAMTSVSGHLLNYEFVGQYKSWHGCSIVSLFEAPVEKSCPQDYEPIKRTIEREIARCSVLVIWTDCDREGENIGFEIINTCLKKKPNITVLRAKFSEITAQSINRAWNNLIRPDDRVNAAVDVRQELDLRIGAAFTRLQTLRFQRSFPQQMQQGHVVSYGSCQFPTLGFVVERFKQRESFVPEPFWKITVLHEKSPVEKAQFNWERVRLFDQLACLVLHQKCLENPLATVVDHSSRPKSKWRPLPLDTVELEKTASRTLRIDAKQTMAAAEKLYTKGVISYPRTETNIFPKEMDLTTLVQEQTNDPAWGGFAGRLLTIGVNPRQGSKTDNAHPPIHPLKCVDNLTGHEKAVYEFVVRRFLACCSQDARGQQTRITIDIAGEKFSDEGLAIIERNYLEVYPYDKWTDKELPHYILNEQFYPTTIEMIEGHTVPPSLLSEADLISLMEKHGIGTDATHADHIEKIKERSYVQMNHERRFEPLHLGLGLVEGYDTIGDFEMSKPHLRANLEAALKLICEGRANAQDVLRDQIARYKEVFVAVENDITKLDQALEKYFGNAVNVPLIDQSSQMGQPVMKCPNCQADLVLKQAQNQGSWYVTCMGYPNCQSRFFVGDVVARVDVTDQICNACLPRQVKRLKFTFKPRQMPLYPLEHISCIGGCDSAFTDAINFRISRPRADAPSNNQRPPQQPRGGGTNGNGLNNRRRRNDDDDDAPGGAGGAIAACIPGPTSNGGGQRSVNVPKPQPRRNDSLDSGFGSSVSSIGSVGDVVCFCGVEAVHLTVRKEGPNKGRPFFACPKPMGDSTKCGFFQWADADPAPTVTRPAQPTSRPVPQPRAFGSNITTPAVNGGWSGRPVGGGSGDGVKCNCNLDAAMNTVKKQGVNIGRQFYCCAKQGRDCKFFQWADDGDSFAQFKAPTTPVATAGRGRGTKRPSPDSTPGGYGGRKCGVCKQTGHNRKNCPVLRDS